MATNIPEEIQEIWQMDLDHVIHPFQDFESFKETGSDIMSKSEGAYIFDAHGNRLLDGCAGLWCVNIGYGRKEMADAIAEQVVDLAYYSTFGQLTTPPTARFAAKLAEYAPGKLNHVMYSTGGSMANDTAIRMVHYYWNAKGQPNRKKIISRVDAYHGMTYLAAGLTGIEFDRIGFDQEDEIIHHVSAPNVYRPRDDMSPDDLCDFLVQELDEKIQELGPENVAAFIAEPIMGAGGVLVPPRGYHKRTQDVCRKYGVLTISDEVVTGFGRLGHVFASQPVFDLTPDIITSAKGISSGYLPLAATIVTDEIYETISAPRKDGGIFSTGFTYAGHPVCCAAGLKNLEIIENEDICGHVLKVGPYFEEQLATLMDLPLVGDVRGKCFMMCVENVGSKETKDLLPPEARVGDRIARHAQERGALVRPIGHLNVLSPPLVMTTDQVDFLVSTLRTSIEATQDDLVREGIWKG